MPFDSRRRSARGLDGSISNCDRGRAAYEPGMSLVKRASVGIVGVAVFVSGCQAVNSDTDSAGGHDSTAKTAPHHPTTGPTGSATHHGSALATVAKLTVKRRVSKAGYDREDEFGPAWKDVDQNGCDTRNDILDRDLDRVRRDGDGCTVKSGILHGPYTGNRIRFRRGKKTSIRVQVDHVVAVSNAHQTGAQQWKQHKRVEFANDPLNLLAVDGPTNEAKSDGDTAGWLPSNKSFRCGYVARQVAVKHKYRLWVTKPEQAAMKRVLSTCPHQKLPTGSTRPHAGHTPATSATTPGRTSRHRTSSRRTAATPTPSSSTRSPQAGKQTAHPGSYCSPDGAHEKTESGTRMVCTAKKGQDRPRWRSR